jgi:hypothetical protein
MIITRFSAAVVVVAEILCPHTDGSLLAGQPATSGLTLAEFEKLHKELQPPKDDLWRSIPWHVSILEGREAAAKTEKPIFVWVASGEPLGCG